jgi:hypothetical protein
MIAIRVFVLATLAIGQECTRLILARQRMARTMIQGEACLIELATNLSETFGRDGDANVDGGLLRDVLGFIAIDVWMKFRGKETIDVEFDASDVSSFGIGGVGKIEAMLNEEFALVLASSFPHFGKPRMFIAPGFEGFERWEIGIICEKA